MHNRLGTCLVLSLGGVAPGLTQSGQLEQTAEQVAPVCSNEGYRQFDFWLGIWQVTDPDGKLVGTNTIEEEYGGCLIRERWEGRGGMTGTSLNTFQPQTRKWHQTWVDNRGGFLLLSGELREGSMVLSGAMPEQDGIVNHRITWTPLAPERVQQRWEVSRDAGTTWEVVFDGLYTRKSD